MGSTLMGSLQRSCCLTEGLFGYAVTYLYLPRSASAYLFPQADKIIYFCSGPISNECWPQLSATKRGFCQHGFNSGHKGSHKSWLWRNRGTSATTPFVLAPRDAVNSQLYALRRPGTQSGQNITHQNSQQWNSMWKCHWTSIGQFQ